MVGQYFAPNVFGARKLKALIFYTIIHFYTKNGHLAFLAPLWGLGATYAVCLRLIGKPIVDFLLVISELFSLRVMPDELRANIDWKSAFLKWVGHFGPKFQVEGDVCTWLDRPVNTLQLCR